MKASFLLQTGEMPEFSFSMFMACVFISVFTAIFLKLAANYMDIEKASYGNCLLACIFISTSELYISFLAMAYGLGHVYPIFGFAVSILVNVLIISFMLETNLLTALKTFAVMTVLNILFICFCCGPQIGLTLLG